MATQTATPLVAPSAEVVGNAFVEQYYNILQSSPEMVYKFYQDSSVLSHSDRNGVLTSVTTMESINHRICSLNYKNCAVEIKTADAQDSCHGGVIVLVTGSLTREDNRTRTFAQTFFLAPQEKGYFVLNDVLRYAEADEPGKIAEITVLDDSSNSLIQYQESPGAINPTKLNQAISQAPNVHEHIEGERQDDNEGEIVTETNSHLNDNHYSAPAPEDGPKKSYASIVSTETRKGQFEVYVPEVQLLVKTEKSVGDSATTPEALPLTTGNITPSDSKGSEDEAEGYSIYLRNLPPSLTVDQLETEFRRFGPIKQNGVQVRSNRQQGFCFGFVEFEDLSSMNSAIQASPITIGGREAVVEMKRTKRRGNGGSSYSGGQGMDRSDSFRGRRNFNGGRSYGRSNYGGNRMDFSGNNPRSRNNELRGRGRGGGRGIGGGGRRPNFGPV